MCDDEAMILVISGVSLALGGLAFFVRLRRSRQAKNS
jgi:LPXTG-motif cell wall-anchored protein